MQASKIEKVSRMEFRFSEKFVIDSDVEPWCREGLRATMLGPGSGKSRNNSLIAEQFLSQNGTVVIFAVIAVVLALIGFAFIAFV